MKIKFFCLLLFLVASGKIAAQHCAYDGSIVLVLDIRNKETNAPVPDLDIRIADQDSVAYFQTSWKYIGKTMFPVHTSDYMRFVYVTEEVMDEVKKETYYGLPKSVLHKYILWLDPQVYRNGSYQNIKKGSYRKDLATINSKNNGLTKNTTYINFSEKILWQGCTLTAIWKNEPDFQTVYFTTDQIRDFEQRKTGK